MSDGPGDRGRLLQVERLSAGFEINGRFVPAVRDVSFHVDAGETLCLVGESGSGKSITALSLIRLLPPAARIARGSIRLEGRELMALAEREMQHVRGAKIGFVFQEPATALNPVFTVGAQIEETLRVHHRATRQNARTRAIELLASVSVPEPHRRVDDYPHQLSGGLRQRVLIAMALSCDPVLLIADEPTTALDVTIQAQILELLKALQQRLALGLLLITHDLGVVAGMADRVAVMYAGRIVEHAPVRALFADPKHPYSRGLLDSIPGGAPGSRLRAIQGTVPSLTSLPPGCSFVTRCPARFDPCPTAHPGDTVVNAATPDLPPEGGSHNPGSTPDLPPQGGSHDPGSTPDLPPQGGSHDPGSTPDLPPQGGSHDPGSTPDLPPEGRSHEAAHVVNAKRGFRLQAEEAPHTVKCYLYGPAREPLEVPK